MIIREQVYTVGNTMNKSLKYLLIFSFICSAQSAILNLKSSILYAYPEGWSDDILINQDTTGHQQRSDISTDSHNNVWVSWDNATWTEGEIYYSKRDSLGNCLIPETIVSNNASRSSMARIAVDNSDNVQFIWRDASPQGIGIWHAKLANDGSIILPSHLAVAGAGGGGSSLLPEMALDKAMNLNNIWDEHPSGYNQMDYTKLDSLGDTIISKIQVSPVGTYTYWPGIGVDSFMNSHLGYRSDSSTVPRLVYTKLDKSGNILISNKVLATGMGPAILADQSQNIHMVYTAPGTIIEYLKLDHDGNILIGPDTISLPEFTSNTYAHMAIDSLQFLHVVWQAYQYDVFYIMYCKLDTLGNYVIPAMKIVHPPHTNGAGEPRIAVDRSNRLHVVWMDYRLNTYDIFYKRGENENAVQEVTRLKSTHLPKITIFPNPFNNSVTIRFCVEQSSSAGTKNMELKIYDVSGKLVKEFNLKSSMVWYGCDNSGKQLPNGVYFLKFETEEFSETIKLLLIK